MKYFFSITLLVFCVSSFAQLFPTKDAHWVTGYNSIGCIDLPSMCYANHFKVEGDTIFAGNTYGKIYLQEIRESLENGEWKDQYSEFIYFGAVRQDLQQKKVFLRLKEDNKDTLLYDFNLDLGDTLPETYNYNENISIYEYPITIEAIDTIDIANNDHIRYHLSGDGPSQFLIEGIGFSEGPLADIYPFFESGFQLSCFEDKYNDLVFNSDCDEIILSTKKQKINEFSFNLYPNPVSELLKIEYSGFEKIESIQIISSEGKLVQQVPTSETRIDLSSLSKGLYYLSITNSEGVATERFIKH